MELSKEERIYLKALVKREAKHLAAEKNIRETDSDLGFLLTQKNYEQFVKNLAKKL
jgi:hypothetical protein